MLKTCQRAIALLYNHSFIQLLTREQKVSSATSPIVCVISSSWSRSLLKMSAENPTDYSTDKPGEKAERADRWTDPEKVTYSCVSFTFLKHVSSFSSWRF